MTVLLWNSRFFQFPRISFICYACNNNGYCRLSALLLPGNGRRRHEQPGMVWQAVCFCSAKSNFNLFVFSSFLIGASCLILHKASGIMVVIQKHTIFVMRPAWKNGQINSQWAKCAAFGYQTAAWKQWWARVFPGRVREATPSLMWAGCSTANQSQNFCLCCVSLRPLRQLITAHRLILVADRTELSDHCFVPWRQNCFILDEKNPVFFGPYSVLRKMSSEEGEGRQLIQINFHP